MWFTKRYTRGIDSADKECRISYLENRAGSCTNSEKNILGCHLTQEASPHTQLDHVRNAPHGQRPAVAELRCEWVFANLELGTGCVVTSKGETGKENMTARGAYRPATILLESTSTAGGEDT